jgi:hypothetical protein
VLALDDTRWSELDQAFGSAEDVPLLLAALATVTTEEGRAEIWFALWRLLDSPEETFTASYAAVPHLVAEAERATVEDRAQALHLVTRVELCRARGRSASVPDDLVEAYADAVERLPAIVSRWSAEPWDSGIAQIYLAALAVGKRQPALAEAVLKVGLDE